MVARTIAAYTGTQALSAPETDGNQQQVPSEEVLRRAHATSIAGVIDQIAQVATHAFELFTELRADSERLSQRFIALSDRVDVVAAVVLHGDRDAAHRLPSVEATDRVLRVRELSFPTSPRPTNQVMQRLYDKCESPPPFEALAEFCPDIDSYRKKYSDPGFLKEDWMQRERFRQQHAQQQRDDRRRYRKEQRRSLALAATGAAAPMDSAESDSDGLAMQQKLKFLNIRSWRERYGTGEGKELLKPPAQRESDQLPEPLTAAGDKKKRRGSLSRKSLSLVKDGEDEPTPNQQHSITKKDAAEGQLGTSDTGGELKEAAAQRGSFGGGSLVVSGAFMQEIDDPGDDLDLVDSSSQQTIDQVDINSNGPAATSDAMAFSDQGLSYFDPYSDHPPPPPPPQPFEDYDGYDEAEDSWANAPPPPPPRVSFTGEYDYDDVTPPPPPPPRQSFVQLDGGTQAPPRRDSFIPPPPPPRRSFVDTDEGSYGYHRDSFVPPPPPSPPPPPPEELRPPPVLIRMPSLLQELQTKRSELRHVDEVAADNNSVSSSPTGVLSPRVNLLQQIRLKQQLRPVGPPATHRAGSQSVSPVNAPLASSIARILDRRQFTTYDSDDSSDSDTDW